MADTQADTSVLADAHMQASTPVGTDTSVLMQASTPVEAGTSALTDTSVLMQVRTQVEAGTSALADTHMQANTSVQAGLANTHMQANTPVQADTSVLANTNMQENTPVHIIPSILFTTHMHMEGSTSILADSPDDTSVLTDNTNILPNAYMLAGTLVSSSGHRRQMATLKKRPSISQVFKKLP